MNKTLTVTSGIPRAGNGKVIKTKIPFRRILIFLLAALEGLVYGYDTGVVAGALLFLKKDMGLTPAMQGLIVSALLFGSLIAAPIAGFLSDRFGARKLIALAGVLFLIGSLGCAFSPTPQILIIFRFLLGVAVGIGTVQVPVYLAELSPAALRGRLTSLYQLMVASGIFLAYVFGYILSHSGDWRMMFMIAAAPAILLTAGVYFLPDSPRWLAKRDRLADAKVILHNMLDQQEAEREYRDLQIISPAAKISLSVVLKEQWVVKILLLVLCMSILQQALGINTIVYYTPTILQAAGFTPSMAILTGVGLQFLSIIVTFILGMIVDRTGRRILLGIGAFIMSCSMLTLGLIFHFGVLGNAFGASISIACLAVFKVAFSLSWGPVLWIVLPEILPLKIRSLAMGACVFASYVANFIVSFSFPVLLASGPTAAFGTFAGFGIAAIALVYWWLPETARKSLEQIETDSNTVGVTTGSTAVRTPR
jgi:sugar porter (SP) family MFS transporter